MKQQLIKKDKEFKSYSWDNRTLESLGQYKDSIACVEEIIFNSYHADAQCVKIDVDKKTIRIQDDGEGFDDINNFFKIGGNFKKNNRTKKGRFIYPSKGIGRFAVQKLGDKFILKTKRKLQTLMFEIRGNFKKEFGAYKEQKKAEFEKGTIWEIYLKFPLSLTELQERIQKSMPLRSDFKISLNDIEIMKRKLNLEDCKSFKIDQKLKNISIKGTLYLNKNPVPQNMAGVWIKAGDRVVDNNVLDMINMERIYGGKSLSVRLCGELEIKGFENIFDVTRRGFIQDSVQFKEFINYISEYFKKIARENAKINEEKNAEKLFKKFKEMIESIIKNMFNEEKETDKFKKKEKELVSIKELFKKELREKELRENQKEKRKKVKMKYQKRTDYEWIVNHPLKMCGMKFGLNLKPLGEHYPECVIDGKRIIINSTHPVLIFAQNTKQDSMWLFKALAFGIAKLKVEKEGGDLSSYYEETLKETLKKISVKVRN